MSDNKPREWLVWLKATQNRWYAKLASEGPREGAIHVIEKSVYDQQVKAADELEKMRREEQLARQDVQTKLKIAVEALENLKKYHINSVIVGAALTKIKAAK